MIRPSSFVGMACWAARLFFVSTLLPPRVQGSALKGGGDGDGQRLRQLQQDEQDNRDTDFTTVGIGVCRESLGCSSSSVANTISVCYYEEGTYYSACLSRPDLAFGTLGIGDSGVSGDPRKVLVACGPCDCFDEILMRVDEERAYINSTTPTDLADCPALASCMKCVVGDPVFRFSPIETYWEAHRALARLQGCELASITSREEQTAAEAELALYKNFPYEFNGHFEGSFVYLGARVINEMSDPERGAYTFEWVDGSGTFRAFRGRNMDRPYTYFQPGVDPNSGTSHFGDEPYLAMSLNENDSIPIPRGEWVDFSARKSPALYKCCTNNVVSDSDYSECSVPLLDTIS